MNGHDMDEVYEHAQVWGSEDAHKGVRESGRTCRILTPCPSPKTRLGSTMAKTWP